MRRRNPSSSARPHLFQETAPDWRPASIAYADEVMPALAAARAAHAPNAEIWISEFAEDPGPAAGAGLSDTIAGALWAADVLGRYAGYAPAAILRWLSKSGNEHPYALIDASDRPRPPYATYWLYGRHLGDRFVPSESNAKTDVAVHAAHRADGALVNKTASHKRVHVVVDRFCSGARRASVEADGYDAKTVRVNGETLDDKNVETLSGEPVAAAHLFDVPMAPTSIRLVVYRRP